MAVEEDMIGIAMTNASRQVVPTFGREARFGTNPMCFAVPAEDQAATAVLFLAGKGNLTRDFTVAYGEGAAADAYSLKLTPRIPERNPK